MLLVWRWPSTYRNKRFNGESTIFPNSDKVNRCEMTRAYLHESVEFILHKKQSWSHRSWSVDQNSHLQDANRRTTQCSFVTVISSNHTRQCAKCLLVLGNSIHVQPNCNEVRREWKVLFGLARLNWTALDLRTRTSTRFNLKFLHMLSKKKRHPGQLHFTFFAKKLVQLFILKEVKSPLPMAKW